MQTIIEKLLVTLSVYFVQVFRMLSESSELVEKLQANVAQFRTQMKAAGFTVSGADSHAIAAVCIWKFSLDNHNR